MPSNSWPCIKLSLAYINTDYFYKSTCVLLREPWSDIKLFIKYEVDSKSIQTEAVFTKREMNNE